MISLLNNPTRHLFFTGKGGVGKTSLSCATAIALADKGKRVLLVSTDPASNLDEVLGVTLNSQPLTVDKAPGLCALNIDPEVAARDYRERIVGPYRGVLPDAAVTSIEEQLSGACTTEIAAFDEFSKLLGEPSSTAQFDYVIFDTAPTGHTLRLLELPAAWTDFLESNAGGTSCLGPLSGLAAQRELYATTVMTLKTASLTTLVLVARPDRVSLWEAERTRNELAALGVSNQRLIINGVFSATDPTDPVATAMEASCHLALSGIAQGLAALPRDEVRLMPFGLLGIEALRAMAINDEQPTSITAPFRCKAKESDDMIPPGLASLIPDLARKGNGVIMTMGKGGVGKTTIASAVAVELARRGFKVQLTTTDPAYGLDSSLGNRLPGLTISRIDPEVETKSYVDEVMSTVGAQMDSKGRALLEEDLRSPCTEEIAVFRAFAKKVDEGGDSIVVLDTAPTGHTLLLLDASEAYHRQITRTASNVPESVRRLLPRLRDPEYTKVLIVALPEATPVHEAAALQKDLKRAGINTFAWVINQSLTPLKVTDPVLAAKRHGEWPFLMEVALTHSKRMVLAPWRVANSDNIAWLSSFAS